jgi:type II secretory pathway component GspD/PulD (secretin)
MTRRRPEYGGARSRTRLVVCACTLVGALTGGCSGGEQQPDYEADVVLGDEDPAEAPLAELPATDFLDFPAATGLLPRDYVMEERVGPLAGYVTKFYRVRSQAGAELIPILNNWKSERARILNVPQHNMLIITELPEQMPLLESILAQVDRVPPQVEIEARVIEILESNGFEFGFELSMDRAPAGDTALRGYDGRFNSNSFLESLANQASPFQGSSLTFAAVGDVIEEWGDFEYVIHALETEGYAEIISEPRVVCRSGQKAIIRVNTKLPIQDFILQSTNNVRITTRYENVGVNLEVTPHVVGRDAITVEVAPKVSNVVRFVINPSAGGIPVPVIAERSASTRVDVRNGELLVIGGLLDRQSRTDDRGIPILGSIPVLGRLFRSTDDFEQRTNVVFVLRIRILTSAEKARDRGRIPLGRGERAELEESETDDDD